MISIELQILIEACKITLLNAPDKDFKQLLASPQLDWQRLKKLVIYHGIRPILYTALSKQKEAAIPADFFGYLRNYATRQSINQLYYATELEQLLQLLETEKIPVLPYKGAMLNKLLYRNNALRECIDIDIYVPKSHAEQALRLLLSKGYAFRLKNEADSIDIKELLNVYGWNEVSLTRGGSKGVDIDFHWKLHSSLYPYQLDERVFLINRNAQVLVKKEVLLPSDETVFLMMLAHHGGRESWLKLKHLCDLALFFKTEKMASFIETLAPTLKKAKLWNTYRLGCYCLQKVFGMEVESKEDFTKSYEGILRYWENAVDVIETFSAKAKSIKLLFSHQDEGFSKRAYWKEYLKFYSVPNVIEEQRLWTFKDKYVMLNLSSKVITYLWQKGFSK